MIYTVVRMDKDKNMQDLNRMAFLNIDVARLYIDKIKEEDKTGFDLLIIPLDVDQHTGVVNGKPVVL